MQREKILSSPRKKKNTERPNGYSVFLAEHLTLLLASRKAAAFGTSCYVVLSHNARGATFAASLENKLSDSALLGYLRRRTLCVLRCKGRKSFLLRAKRKIRNARMGIPYFWRRRKDLNLRAGCPTYTLSRGASSPLEYFSI